MNQLILLVESQLIELQH